jgi:hypothetical protein
MTLVDELVGQIFDRVAEDFQGVASLGRDAPVTVEPYTGNGNG